MYAEYKDRVAFFVVYLREAHPEDGRQSQANVRDGVVFNQPTEFAERLSVAAEMYSKLELSIPCVIDGMDNQVGTAYAAMPDRLYLIGLDGRIAFKGEKGPRGFKPEQLREFLDLYLLLLDVAGDKIRPAEDKD
jgi:hypothetical protein